jgi:2,4'-dihydroxyacetophenone dioxygenase
MITVQARPPLYRDNDKLPWVPFTPYNAAVGTKLLKVDPVSGQSVTMLRVPGGQGLGVHNHYGTVIVYTVQGAWRYLEHDWVSRAGDLVYESAGSRHTLQVEPGEDMLAFIIVEGALEFIGADGKSMGLENWKTFLERYYRFCEANRIRPVDLTSFE